VSVREGRREQEDLGLGIGAQGELFLELTYYLFAGADPSRPLPP